MHPLISINNLESNEKTEIFNEIDDWLKEMKILDKDLADEKIISESLPIPEIRKINEPKKVINH